MATKPVTLDDHWHIAGRSYSEVVLRETTTLDIVEAREEAEEAREVIMADGRSEITIVASPMRAAVALIRRQIVSLDGEEIPIVRAMLRGLSPRDFNKICSAIEDLDQSVLAVGRSATRGRDDSSGADA
jgi:phage FluMu protein gp41